MPSARRALDAEGWDSDVALLRKQLAAVERRLLQTRLAARLDGAPSTILPQPVHHVWHAPRFWPASAPLGLGRGCAHTCAIMLLELRTQVMRLLAARSLITLSEFLSARVHDQRYPCSLLAHQAGLGLTSMQLHSKTKRGRLLGV